VVNAQAILNSGFWIPTSELSEVRLTLCLYGEFLSHSNSGFWFLNSDF
jgi:hypothetical protein